MHIISETKSALKRVPRRFVSALMAGMATIPALLRLRLTRRRLSATPLVPLVKPILQADVSVRTTQDGTSGDCNL